MNEFIELYKLAAPYGLGAVVACVVVAQILQKYLPGYFGQKGYNQAMKEDIAHLTKLVEQVKDEFNKSLEDHKARNQMRMACLDTRMRAHQEAYALWREINQALDSARIYAVVERCDEWWGKNCLYLEPDARAAFLRAFVSARDLDFYKAGSVLELIKQERVNIQEAGSIIERCVALPELGTQGIQPKKANA